MLLRCLALLVFMPISAFAGDTFFQDWQTTDTALLGSALGLTAVDWGQSKSATRETVQTETVQIFHTDGTQTTTMKETRSRQYHETNPILGRHPSSGDVDRYFAVAALSTLALAAVLPTQYRRYFLTGVIVVESFVVLRNHHLGIRMSF